MRLIWGHSLLDVRDVIVLCDAFFSQVFLNLGNQNFPQPHPGHPQVLYRMLFTWKPIQIISKRSFQWRVLCVIQQIKFTVSINLPPFPFCQMNYTHEWWAFLKNFRYSCHWHSVVIGALWAWAETRTTMKSYHLSSFSSSSGLKLGGRGVWRCGTLCPECSGANSNIRTDIFTAWGAC